MLCGDQLKIPECFIFMQTVCKAVQIPSKHVPFRSAPAYARTKPLGTYLYSVQLYAQWAFAHSTPCYFSEKVYSSNLQSLQAVFGILRRPMSLTYRNFSTTILESRIWILQVEKVLLDFNTCFHSLVKRWLLLQVITAAVTTALCAGTLAAHERNSGGRQTGNPFGPNQSRICNVMSSCYS